MERNIGMTQWQLPCPLADCVKVTAELGLKTIQIDLGSSDKGYPLTDPALQAKLKKDAEETGVSIVSVVLNDLCGHGFTRDDPSVAYETMRLGVETAAAMGVYAICMPSFFDNAIKDEESFGRTVKALQYICDLALPKGISVYTENVLAAPDLTRLFFAVARPNLKLLFDSQNYRQMADREAIPAIRAVAGRIGSFVHIKDGVEKLGDRPLGEGNCGLAQTLEALLRDGFSGSWILENKFNDLDDVKACAERLCVMLDEAEARIAGKAL